MTERTLVLLGDSIIDNGAYLMPGEPDVAAQVRQALPDWQVDMRAVDGNRTHDVMGTLNDLPTGAHIVLSVGGNDALAEQGRVADPSPATFAHVLAELRAIREAFRAVYAPLLDALGAHRLMVMTIYNPRFTGEEAVMQAPGEGGLSAFNDVIQQEALARDAGVLDLRALFVSDADYANAIEPSAIGGAKIARSIAQWAQARRPH